MEEGGGRKKLLVLHLKGLLASFYHLKHVLPDAHPDATINRFHAYRRPGADEFLQFCFDNFVVGVWSSAKEHNAQAFVDFIFGEGSLGWRSFGQERTTTSAWMHRSNETKSLCWKELSKLWEADEEGLPWPKGTYGPSNTVMIDDDAYSSQLNPPFTSIIIQAYRVPDPLKSTAYLEELRRYLRGLAAALCVRAYLEREPFSFLEQSGGPGASLASRFLDAVAINDNVSLLARARMTAARWTSPEKDARRASPERDSWRRREPPKESPPPAPSATTFWRHDRYRRESSELSWRQEGRRAERVLERPSSNSIPSAVAEILKEGSGVTKCRGWWKEVRSEGEGDGGGDRTATQNEVSRDLGFIRGTSNSSVEP